MDFPGSLAQLWVFEKLRLIFGEVALGRRSSFSTLIGISCLAFMAAQASRLAKPVLAEPSSPGWTGEIAPGPFGAGGVSCV